MHNKKSTYFLEKILIEVDLICITTSGLEIIQSLVEILIKNFALIQKRSLQNGQTRNS